MLNRAEFSISERLSSLGDAYHGLASAVTFDDRLASTYEYVVEQIAELILSDELVDEIENRLSGRFKATASQTVNELCNNVFGSRDYTCQWTENRQWLGDAIIAASQLNSTENKT